MVTVVLLTLGACGGQSEEALGDHLGAATLEAYTADWPTLTGPPEPVAAVEPVPELPPLPVPGPLPLDAYQAEPEITVGHITIPRLGVDEPLHQGMSLTAINRGPSYWEGTAEPGQVGNMVIAGHRTTYSRPFYDLDLVEPGDEMIVSTDADTFTYRAVRTDIVGPDAMWIADQTYAHTATTFACHPKGSLAERIVVFWQLVDDEGEPVPDLA